MTNKTVPLIITFPKGQLDKTNKDRLTKHGIIWLEAESDHKAIQQLHISQSLFQSEIDGDAIIASALKAIARGTDTVTMREFVNQLANRIKEPSK